jgi:plastocyanin
MKTRLALLIACLALAVAAAGCGGDDDEEEEGGGSAATTTTDTGAAGGASKSAEVEQKDITFQPDEVTVARGGTVTWTNGDDANHDVTKTGGPGADFSSGTGDMAKGDTFEQKFDTAGTVEYVCTVHPNMTGKVTVR